MLEVRDVTKNYATARGETRALAPTSVVAEPGSVTIIGGDSGSGKSTLLGILGLLIRPTAGQVLLDGLSVGDVNESVRDRLRQTHVGIVPQHPRLLGDLTAAQNVAMSLVGRDHGAVIEAALGAVGLQERSDHPASTLSGGEAQRLSLARAIAKRPALILADEPTSGLDDRNAEIICGLLAGLAQEGHAVVIATHDLRTKPFGTTWVHVESGGHG